MLIVSLSLPFLLTWSLMSNFTISSHSFLSFSTRNFWSLFSQLATTNFKIDSTSSHIYRYLNSTFPITRWEVSSASYCSHVDTLMVVLLCSCSCKEINSLGSSLLVGMHELYWMQSIFGRWELWSWQRIVHFSLPG